MMNVFTLYSGLKHFLKKINFLNFHIIAYSTCCFLNPPFSSTCLSADVKNRSIYISLVVTHHDVMIPSIEKQAHLLFFCIYPSLCYAQIVTHKEPKKVHNKKKKYTECQRGIVLPVLIKHQFTVA